MRDVEFILQVKHYLKVINKRKWLVITPLFVFPVLSLLVSFVVPKRYEASSTILIQEKKMVSPLMENLVISSTVSQRIAVLKQEILAWPRLNALIKRLNLDSDYAFNKDSITDVFKFKVKNKVRKILKMKKKTDRSKQIALNLLITKLKKSIEIDMKGEEIVVISYEGTDPAKTQALVNTLCDILIEKNLSTKEEDTSSAIDFIKEQLAIYSDKLEKSEKSLIKFKEVYGDIGGLTETKKAPVQGADSQEDSIDRADSYLDGVTLNEINKELAKMEAGLVFSSVDYTDEHPKIKEIKKKQELLKTKRDQYIEKLAKKIGAEPEEFLEMADSLPRQQETQERLKRENLMNSKIYSSLLERLETAKITERLDKSNNRTKFRVIEPARFPVKPVWPDRSRFLFLGFLLGLGVGCLYIYLLEFSDSSFRTEEQLEESFDKPVLGVISKLAEK